MMESHSLVYLSKPPRRLIELSIILVVNESLSNLSTNFPKFANLSAQLKLVGGGKLKEGTRNFHHMMRVSSHSAECDIVHMRGNCCTV